MAMATHQDGDPLPSNSSTLLRQILQPLPLPDTQVGSRREAGGEGDADGDDAGADTGGDVHAHHGSPNDTDDAVAENVVSIVDGMGLDENEAAALRLAIANGDANIRGALELFRYVPVGTVDNAGMAY